MHRLLSVGHGVMSRQRGGQQPTRASGLRWSCAVEVTVERRAVAAACGVLSLVRGCIVSFRSTPDARRGLEQARADWGKGMRNVEADELPWIAVTGDDGFAIFTSRRFALLGSDPLVGSDPLARSIVGLRRWFRQQGSGPDCPPRSCCLGHPDFLVGTLDAGCHACSIPSADQTDPCPRRVHPRAATRVPKCR